jgi:hypothetical protein
VSGDTILWFVGLVVACVAGLALVIWLGLLVIDLVKDRIHRRYLRWWRGRRDHGTWLSIRYRLGARLLLPLIEKQYHAINQTQEKDPNEFRSGMLVAFKSLARKARGT